MLVFTAAGTKEAKRVTAVASMRPCFHLNLGTSYKAEPQIDWSTPRH